MRNAIQIMKMQKKFLQQLVVLVAVSALTTACDDPAAIEDHTILGSWAFVRGSCPLLGSTFTHTTRGYAYSVDFGADARVTVFRSDSLVGRMSFTLRRERETFGAPPNSLVLRFSSNLLLSESALGVRALTTDSLAVFGVEHTDACSYWFARASR
jgi:hypothetical protein